MTVVSTKEGKNLGKVSKMAVDTKKGKVVAFVLAGENQEEKVIQIEEVTAYGKDSLMVFSASSLKKVGELNDIAESVAFGRKIIGLKIMTDKGEGIGEVGSFHFDEKTGEITHYEVSGGPLPNLIEGKGLLPKAGVVTLGTDALVVTKEAAVVSETMKVGPGLKHIAAQLKAKTKKEVEETIKDIKKKTKVISDSFSEKSVSPKKKI